MTTKIAKRPYVQPSPLTQLIYDILNAAEGATQDENDADRAKSLAYIKAIIARHECPAFDGRAPADMSTCILS